MFEYDFVLSLLCFFISRYVRSDMICGNVNSIMLCVGFFDQQHQFLCGGIQPSEAH